MSVKRKIFGIGFHKTGTTSLANALYILGFYVAGYFGTHKPNIQKVVYEEARMLADRYDGGQDTPWPVIYKELDQWYPGSKFILTIRPTESWINSVLTHFKSHYIPAHQWIYGVRSAVGNEAAYIKRYEQHNQEVIDYFKNRPNDFICMDITAGDGWEKLCPFLGVEIPELSFPTQNRAGQRAQPIFIRGFRYIRQNLFGNNMDYKGNEMSNGVSSNFLRELLHYHYASFDRVWAGVMRLGEDQFNQSFPYSKGSIREHLLQQIQEEEYWLHCLNCDGISLPEDMGRGTFLSKEAVYQYWHKTHQLLRRHAADLVDDNCNQKIIGCGKYVWEVYIHLVNTGIQHRFVICQILSEYHEPVEEQSFISFYN